MKKIIKKVFKNELPFIRTYFQLLILIIFATYQNSEAQMEEKISGALKFIEKIENETISEQITICKIPAPPFKEKERAEYIKKRFIEIGLQNVKIDLAGNVIGKISGNIEKPIVILSAHLDTVFPLETNLTIKNEQGKIYCPGIGDDSRGLAGMIAVARAFLENSIKINGTLYFIATVGEEGIGDLRGVKYIFEESELKNKVDYFISLDGCNVDRIVIKSVGSVRYKVIFNGPGGHSWSSFGIVNPINALGKAIDKISRIEVTSNTKTTYNIGRVGGGTSVNSIPFEAWMEIDMRSESIDELKKIESKIITLLNETIEEENRLKVQEKDKLSLKIGIIGKRPAGETHLNSFLVRKVIESSEYLGITQGSIKFDASSTDSNIPMSLGIQAITIGAGGKCGGSHSLDEWFDKTNSHIGIQRAFILVFKLFE